MVTSKDKKKEEVRRIVLKMLYFMIPVIFCSAMGGFGTFWLYVIVGYNVFFSIIIGMCISSIMGIILRDYFLGGLFK